MPTRAPTHHTALIDHMNAEWQAIGRSPGAIRALARVARRDPGLAQLVLGTARHPASCPTPLDLVDHLRRATGRRQREDAARLIRVLLREAGSDPFIGRLLVQALIPGLISVASMLQWGVGGEWSDGDEFFAELITTTWLVVQEWSGQDRAYAVLDLLSAIRCRLRRQLFRAKDQSKRVISMGADDAADRTSSTETLLDELARALVEQGARDDMPLEELQVLYSHSVLGYSIAELAVLTGRDRRALYTRRDRARRRLCA
jgi:DNA-directed RNA polymerase specialized sigma24 family protein